MWLSREAILAHADQVRRTSATLIRGLFPVEKIDQWNRAFQPLLAEAVERERDDPNRGVNRYYVTLPFSGLWSAP
jgi:hypothetical protein